MIAGAVNQLSARRNGSYVMACVLLKGHTMLLLCRQVTHRLEELQWADTASYMEHGKIQFTGTAQHVAQYMRSLGAH